MGVGELLMLHTDRNIVLRQGEMGLVASFVACATDFHPIRIPSDESLGYFLSPLRAGHIGGWGPCLF
jgi:hypothetical protein